jgi:hypothetical protein
MTVTERRAAIAEVIDCVFVAKSGDPIEDRLFVCLRGRGPSPVAYDPNDTGPVAPFQPDSCPVSARLRRHGTADLTELRNALAAFLDGHTVWPPFRHFQAHGQAILYAEAKRNGGPRYWASMLGLEYAPPIALRRAWPDDRIRSELQKYLGGRPSWPNWKQFIADHKRQLRVAIGWTGGTERWAEEMGVTPPPRGRSSEGWSYELVREGVRQLAGDSKSWPTRRQFEAAGLATLEQAIRRLGVRERLLAELNLTRHYNRWTDDRIRETLDDLLEGRDTWPNLGEFTKANLAGMRAVLLQRGTLRTWAEHYGFEPLRPGRVARRLTSPGPAR